MKTRILSFLLAVVMLFGAFGLVSCKQQEENEDEKIVPIDDEYRNWYEIFVYSFYDTDNDGIGDLNGVTAKLDYIADMGFTGIWLMPIHPSPTYHKYDVKDYREIDPAYGTLEDFDNLVTEAHKRGIRVIIDLVLNHSADSHPWFKEACQYIRDNGTPGGKYGDYYNFSTEKLGGYSPVTGTNYYYESRFWSGMPDLNLDSEKVRTEIVDIMTYWINDHKVDGFRLDAVTSYYTGYVDKNVSFLSWLNGEAKKIDSDCYIVGEAWETSDYLINRYYESGIDSFFLFTGAQATGTIANIVKQNSGKQLGELMVNLQETYKDELLAPFLGNHDTMRPGSFMPGEEKVKMAAGVMAMMSGGCFVYYGEEIGMISKGGNTSDPAKRIAMKWQAKNIYEGCCYLPPENTPVDETSYYYPSVEEQLNDPDSILCYYRNAMQLRNKYAAIPRGAVEYFPEGQSNYTCILKKTYKDDSVVIVFNMDSFDQTVTLDSAALGINEKADELLVDSSSTVEWDGSTLKMPPYSIVILK